MGFGIKAFESSPEALRVPTAQRLFQVASALQAGAAAEEIIAATHFDPWFVRQPADIAAVRSETLARAPRLEMLTAGGHAAAEALWLQRRAPGAALRRR
jgi:hypothetical protein